MPDKYPAPPSPLSTVSVSMSTGIGTKRKTPPSPISPKSDKAMAMSIDAVPDLVNSVDGGSLKAASASPARSEDESLPGQPTDDDYARGVVSCEKCGEEIPFRHPSSGGFTLDLWTTHQLKCHPKPSNPTARDPIIFTPETTAESLTNPPPKKRRSKRTEDERIEYLRSDPFVAKFEAYRVLCASCNKWIRLRPNSTYCSIPWDAHRKSCLSKKANSKHLNHAPTGELQRTGLGLGALHSDPYVRKLESGRALCAQCNSWVQVAGEGPGAEGGSANMQGWLSHREACGKGEVNDVSRHDHFPTVPIGTSHSSLTPTPSSASAPGNNTSNPHTTSATSTTTVQSPSHFKDYAPNSHTSVHESRRRNAEQREAILRQDELLSEVEPNKVFCKLCRKWVQLRQDSSFCAYPWLQHKNKCLARHEKRLRKEATIRTYQHGSHPHGHGDRHHAEQDQLESGDEDEPMSPYQPESEDGMNSAGEEHVQGFAHGHGHGHGKVKSRIGYGHGHGHGHGEGYRDGSHPRATSSKPSSHARSESGGGGGDPRLSPSMSLASADGGQYRSRNGHGHGHGHAHVHTQGQGQGREWEHGRFRLPPGLADLDSPEGRLSFIHRSIHYLFRITYERSDDMSIASLMNYLNAAMPMDKHEDFDLAEVTKAARSLHEQRKVVVDNDLIRLV